MIWGFAVPVTWEPSAATLLGQRDRFTQKAIKEEFEETFNVDFKQGIEPGSTSIAFDPDHKGYLTPVADERYSVIWYLEDDEPGSRAVVRAVVPTTRFDKRMTGLRDRVRKIVQIESGQKVDLK